jgi:Holliday junction resolvasome RuvABC DNA-binding subunit
MKQKLHEMIDSLPESKLIYIVRIVSDLRSMLDDTDDDIDMALAKKADEARERNDFVSFNDALKEMGFSIEQIQN